MPYFHAETDLDGWYPRLSLQSPKVKTAPAFVQSEQRDLVLVAFYPWRSKFIFAANEIDRATDKAVGGYRLGKATNETLPLCLKGLIDNSYRPNPRIDNLDAGLENKSVYEDERDHIRRRDDPLTYTMGSGCMARSPSRARKVMKIAVSRSRARTIAIAIACAELPAPKEKDVERLQDGDMSRDGQLTDIATDYCDDNRIRLSSSARDLDIWC
ncbi:hypothetical protein B0T10DRAFT_581144 [Thelonectria olida]|uniref:Uncharacterized protein n=1 Tax=Thelonectria olida TaxID=1576542 RepID=A0A9P9AKC0_9HYPO|nr:hypothetical protein B0T10DRAFT_581144 [Thelonectria olida]